jgi:hypothetical protein
MINLARYNPDLLNTESSTVGINPVPAISRAIALP